MSLAEESDYRNLVINLAASLIWAVLGVIFWEFIVAPSIRLTGKVPPPRQAEAHVAVILHGLHICGAARHCLELLGALGQRGVHTTMIAPFGGGQWGTRFLEAANEVIVLNDPSIEGEELENISWRGSRRVITAHYDPAVAWVTARPREADVYTHFHTEPEFGYFTRTALVRSGQVSRKIFFPSAETAGSYRTLLERTPSWWAPKCEILPNGLPAEIAGAPRCPRVPYDGTLRLGIVSRLDPDKISIPLLLGTLDALRSLVPRLHVRVAGDGLLGSELRCLVRRQGMEGIVEFLGWTEDVHALYSWCHASFLASHSETMPYVVMESVQSGRPVVVPALGHFASHGSDHPLVHTFEPNNIMSAVDAITRALDSPATTPSDDDEAVNRWRKQALQQYDLA